MSITTAGPCITSTPYTAARWISRASSVPEITRGRMPVSSTMRARNSLPFSASRVALVAAARISSTPCDSAMRRNLASASSAALMAALGQALAVEPAGPEAHHLLLAVDHLEGQIRADPHHDHVDRVRADVDGCQAHGAQLGREGEEGPRDARVRAYNPCFGRDRRPASRPRVVAKKSYHEASERSVTACCTAGCARFERALPDASRR